MSITLNGQPWRMPLVASKKTGQTSHYFKAPCEGAIHARKGPVCAQIHPLRQCNMQYNGLWDQIKAFYVV